MNLFKLFFKGKNSEESSKKQSCDDLLLEPLKDPHTLPDCIEDFKWHHIKILKRLNEYPVKGNFSEFATVKIDILKFISISLKLNLIKKTTYVESLKLLKNDTLKLILRKYNLKVSGNKNELIERIVRNIDVSSVKSLNIYSDYYILTEIGCNLTENLYNNSKKEEMDFLDRVLNLIENGQLNTAYRLICKRNAESPFPVGIGVDWARWFYDGIPIERENVYIKHLNKSSNRFTTVLAIYCNISGNSASTLHLEDTYKYVASTVDYERKVMLSEEDMISYKLSGIKEYSFLAALDDRTCPICGKLDGQKFKVRNYRIGVNCPPMHEGCRCATIAYFGQELSANSKRWSRNPQTGRPEYVPANMTYKEWAKLNNILDT